VGSRMLGLRDKAIEEDRWPSTVLGARLQASFDAQIIGP
jgi:hypothetical protein